MPALVDIWTALPPNAKMDVVAAAFALAEATSTERPGPKDLIQDAQNVPVNTPKEWIQEAMEKAWKGPAAEQYCPIPKKYR